MGVWFFRPFSHGYRVGDIVMKKMIKETKCDKYLELLNSLQVGQIYRYIGNGEFEIVDLKALVLKAIENAESVYND